MARGLAEMAAIDFNKVDLKALFRDFNRRYFGGTLPGDTDLRFSGRLKNATGTTTAKLKWKPGATPPPRRMMSLIPVTTDMVDISEPRITMSTKLRYEEELFNAFFLHEMVHLWLIYNGWPFEHHGTRFRAKAAEVGRAAGVDIPIVHQLTGAEEIDSVEKTVGLVIVEPNSSYPEPYVTMFRLKDTAAWVEKAKGYVRMLRRTVRVYHHKTKAHAVLSFRSPKARGFSMNKVTTNLAKELDMTGAKLIAEFPYEKREGDWGRLGAKLTEASIGDAVEFTNPGQLTLQDGRRLTSLPWGSVRPFGMVSGFVMDPQRPAVGPRGPDPYGHGAGVSGLSVDTPFGSVRGAVMGRDIKPITDRDYRRRYANLGESAAVDEGYQEQQRLRQVDQHGVIVSGPEVYVTNIQGTVLGSYKNKREAGADLEAAGLEPEKGTRGMRWKPKVAQAGSREDKVAKLKRLAGHRLVDDFAYADHWHAFRFADGGAAQEFEKAVRRMFPRAPANAVLRKMTKSYRWDVKVDMNDLNEGVDDWGKPGALLVERRPSLAGADLVVDTTDGWSQYAIKFLDRGAFEVYSVFGHGTMGPRVGGPYKVDSLPRGGEWKPDFLRGMPRSISAQEVKAIRERVLTKYGYEPVGQLGRQPIPNANRNRHAPQEIRQAADRKWYLVNGYGEWGVQGYSTSGAALQAAARVARIDSNGRELPESVRDPQGAIIELVIPDVAMGGPMTNLTSADYRYLQSKGVSGTEREVRAEYERIYKKGARLRSQGVYPEDLRVRLAESSKRTTDDWGTPGASR